MTATALGEVIGFLEGLRIGSDIRENPPGYSGVGPLSPGDGKDAEEAPSRRRKTVLGGGVLALLCGSPSVSDYGSRRKRREEVKRALACLAAVRSAEQRSLDNVPDNFQNSDSFESGENAVDTLDEIIDLLASVY